MHGEDQVATCTYMILVTAASVGDTQLSLSLTHIRQLFDYKPIKRSILDTYSEISSKYIKKAIRHSEIDFSQT